MNIVFATMLSIIIKAISAAVEIGIQLLMNYFRWSAVCGIAEMIIFALILKRIEQENKSDFIQAACLP